MRLTQIYSLKPKQLVIGHRGNPGNPLNSERVENTCASFRNAVDTNVHADGVELDVHLTKDNVLVVHHDDTLGEVLVRENDDNKRLISDYTYDELQEASLFKIERYEWKVRDVIRHAFWANEMRIPKLEEVEIPDDKKLFLELKFPEDLEPLSDKPEDIERVIKGSEYLERLVRENVEYLKSAGLVGRTYILSFVPSALDRIKDHSSELLTAYNICNNETRRVDFEKLLKALKRGYEFDIVNPPFEQTTGESVKVIHGLGLKTYPWTWHENAEQELAEVKRLFKAGADGVITNQPGKARDIRDGVTVPTVT